MLEPAGLMATAWVMVGPVNNATLCIPLVHTIEGNGVPRFQRRDSGSQIDVVRNENDLTGRKREDEALMTTSVIVVGKEL